MHRLSTFPYRDRPRASREIAALAPHLPSAVQNRFDLLLASSPAPEQGLHYFTRLREQHPGAFDRLTRSAVGLRHLVAVFTYSRFLAEEILEHPAGPSSSWIRWICSASPPWTISARAW